MKNIVPEQIEGKQLDCHKSIDFSSIAKAESFYWEAKKKLFDVSHWHHITKGPSAIFCIVDASNQVVDRPVHREDHIRIDIPGPGLPSAKGYDWVNVEDIIQEESITFKRVVLTLRPCPDPTNEDKDIAHFFRDIATSTILIEQHNTNVFLHYAGRNEVINTENASIADNIRNFLVGLGAKMGASFPQWKALIEGLGEIENQSIHLESI